MAKNIFLSYLMSKTPVLLQEIKKITTTYGFRHEP